VIIPKNKLKTGRGFSSGQRLLACVYPELVRAQQLELDSAPMTDRPVSPVHLPDDATLTMPPVNSSASLMNSISQADKER
jgi:hypothetical protein